MIAPDRPARDRRVRREMMRVVPFEADGVRGFLHRPDDAAGAGLVLTHGAGGNCNAPLLVEAATAFSAAGLHVLRVDLPFRQRRASGPPSPAGAAADRAGLRRAVAALRAIVPGRIILGGQSYGGRQATMLAADEPGLVEGLLVVFLSAARARQTRAAAHRAFSPSQRPRIVRARHRRSVRLDRRIARGRRGDPGAHPGVADRARGPRSAARRL